MFRPFLLALSFLTRIPIKKEIDFSGVTLAQAAWAFPVAGAIVGALAGGIYLGLLRLGLTHTIAAWVTLGFSVWLTGGLHEDGLADMADGLAHGRDREQKLAIMRDSRIGAYGVLALVITLAIRANAIALFPGGIHTLLAFAAIGAASRACMVILMHALPSARADGLAAQAGRPSRNQTLIAAVIGISALCLAGKAMLSIPTLALSCLIIGRIAKQHFGGITGDVLGTMQQISETVLLVIMAG